MLNLIAGYDHNTLEYIQRARKTQNIQAQNQMINIIGTIVRGESIEVSEVLFWRTKLAIFRKKEQISMLLRYYYGGTIYERFICFEEAAYLDVSLTAQLIDTFERCKLNYRTILVFLAYELLRWFYSTQLRISHELKISSRSYKRFTR